VGSRQMAEIRFSLRGKATVLMGKNTMVRCALRKRLESNPKLEMLLPLIKENIGLVFCHDDVASVRKLIMSNRVPAAAKQGNVAPLSVTIPAGPTGLEPSQTSFFQALGISTKIVKGQVELQGDFQVIKEGDRVSASQATLLQKLNVKPFSHGLVPTVVFDDGIVYPSSVLDVTPEQIKARMMEGITNIAALSREVGFPTKASAPHFMMEGFKNCVALCLESNQSFPQMDALKTLLASA